jgi:hypothetical protein
MKLFVKITSNDIEKILITFISTARKLANYVWSKPEIGLNTEVNYHLYVV